MFMTLVRTLLILVIVSAIVAGVGNAPVAADSSLSPQAAQTLQTLWSMDLERQTPFDVQMVNSQTDGDYKTDQFYISSAPVAGRPPDRVLCTFSRIIKPGVKSPVLLSLTAGDTPGALHWLAQHLGCAALDIEYRNFSLPVRSKWSNPNKYPYPNYPFTVTPAVTDCFVYSFIMATRRVIDYLSDQPEIDSSKIGAGGGSFGGWYALLLAAIDNRVNCVGDTYACGSQGNKCGWHTLNVAALPPDQRALWLASYDPTTFAAHNKAATLMIMGTNDYSFWLCDALHQYDILPGEKRIVILPNFNHNAAAVGYKPPDCGVQWLSSTYRGDAPFPTIDDPVAKGKTYTFRVTDSIPATRATLYWSPGTAGSRVWPARYWIPFDAHVADGVWKIDLPETYAGLSGLVYATVFDEKGRAASSRLVSRDGDDPATGKAAWKNGALWDIERGPGAWRVPGSGKRVFGSGGNAELGGVDGLKLTPPADGKLCLLTDSVQLASPIAMTHKGIWLIIDGNGLAGHLRVSLDRNAGSIDEVSFVNELDFASGVGTYDIPWPGFQATPNATGPAPFDALRIEAVRAGQTPIVLQSIAFFD